MPSFEKVCENVLREKDILKKCLIGGALSMIPILSVPYFLVVSREMRARKSLYLPEWEDIISIWKEGAAGILLFLLYFAGPAIIGLAISCLLKWVLFGGIAYIHYFPLMVILAMSPSFFAVSLYMMSAGATWKELLDVSSIFSILMGMSNKLILPTLAFWGLMLLGAPFYGFAFFLGFLIFLIYIQIQLMLVEKRK